MEWEYYLNFIYILLFIFKTEIKNPDGRGYQNLMRLMNEDGIFKYLPKQDDAWVEFLQPFMKLTRKEKKRFNNKN